MGQGLQEAWHFFAYVAAITAALLVIGGFVVVARMIGVPIPLDIVSLIDEFIERWRRRRAQRNTVNVAFVDRKGKRMRFSHLVTVTMHNGSGAVYTLKGGFFYGCDGHVIRWGARVKIDYQDGLFQEDLAVQLDRKRETLVVRSRHTVAEILARVSHERPEAA